MYGDQLSSEAYSVFTALQRIYFEYLLYSTSHFNRFSDSGQDDREIIFAQRYSNMTRVVHYRVKLIQNLGIKENTGALREPCVSSFLDDSFNSLKGYKK